MEIKHREIDARISGEVGSSTGINFFALDVPVEAQRTLSHSTPFPVIRKALREGYLRGTGAEWVFTHRDWGSAFVTQRSTVESSHSGLYLTNLRKGHALPFYNVSHDGPLLLGGHSPMSFYTDTELGNAEQTLWTLGARAVNRARPNKPTVDLPVLVGELRKDGIPTIIGSLASRSRNLRDVFRQGGKEYLNVQFGWAPLVKDLVAMVSLISTSRRILEQYEKDIDKLVRRRYHFPDQTDVATTLDFPASSSLYNRMGSTPWGSIPEDHLTFRPAGQVPEQVTTTTVKTWFSGGFRFYHRSVPEALEELSLYEEKANALLGTRLDPEVVYNLVPWTWLLDWFVNFGDVVANTSAISSDNLVMQYGYLMRTTSIRKELTWPQGLWGRRPTGQLSSSWKQFLPTYSQTTSLVTKQRGKASPFGFGLNPSDFSPDQLAILAALGLSRS